DGDVEVRAVRAQRGDDGVDVEILIAQRDIEFVKDYETKRRIAHEFERLRPGPLRGGDVALEILRFPGEALAHGVPGDLIPKAGERIALCRAPSSFDELHHAHAMTATEHAQREAESGSRFTLARTSVDDEEAFLDCFAGNLGILHCFALRHFVGMAFELVFVGLSGHASPLMVSGNPATTSTTRSARAAIR